MHEDALTARANGAEGIGLVRTEHMFFGSGERLRTVRRMIMVREGGVCAAQAAPHTATRTATHSHT